MINLLFNGVALQRFTYNGKTYIVCPDSGDFEVEIIVNHNGGLVRREVCISVDGLSVMDGKAASTATRGYVTTDARLRLPGWRLNDDRVAKFEFKAAEGSYAASKGAAQNVGCVGVVVFAERRNYSVAKSPHWIGGGSGSTMTFDSTLDASYSATRGVDFSCSVSSGPTRSASVGAGFDAAADFVTTTTSFERGAEVAREVVYYRTRQWLREAGIPVPSEGGANGEAWPDDVVACAPPPGWRG